MVVVEQDIYAAARDAETQAALRTKVSRERLGAELSGMLTGKVSKKYFEPYGTLLFC